MTRPTDLTHELADSLSGFSLSPGAEARTLIAHAAGCDLIELFTRWELSDDVVARARHFVARRLSGEPVQHITGQAHFRFETVEVGPGVFIPRPETELLAGWAIDFLSRRAADSRVCVELCAGSGAITRSVVKELGGVVAHANELSDSAARYLRRNLAGLGVSIHVGDLSEAFAQLAGTVDLVVVNPPYVPETRAGRLHSDVARDPQQAVFGGVDGLTTIRRVVQAAGRLLKQGGALACEHDDSHQSEVLELVRSSGFVEVQGHQDLPGADRFVTALRGVD
ncbi:peptide chain release factor N(5)-glutamine methyltransferase [Tessaracoccus sp. OH4464_COT-324]|uniref:peptide chain release factor N(5)-glutamine methyltransferase n=1 Tax=Tessaracoccus sp. OH4464_COT-324 TaxID=2491059 RepID=UPI000F63DEB8|nr:peptide chain release factor N(5)-glutamine methyltransferase [Tessaracoccus sp. OH4464_COT-324]RRD47881.1 peptide chain release factor N(5)-glutamine methyltransferase [Tessaracoccus sp. OH4464_COT-324]